MALPAAAQTPDSTAAPVAEPAPDALPADSVAVDSARALPRPAVAPFGPAPGRPATPVPALTAALDVQTLLADRPGAFAYALGAPERVGGVALGEHGVTLPALVLDGRSYADPFTGAPRYDLLPAAAVGPLRLADAAFGRPGAVAAAVRPFRLGVPVTEIRYGAGQEGVQQVSGTHAQTRRPPAFLRGRSPDARVTGTLHVASRRADGLVRGGALRHLDALGRLLLTRPGLAAEAGVVHADRTEGARLGLVAADGRDPFDGLFLQTASVGDEGATRRTLRTEAWARARLPVFAAPLEVGGAVAEQRLVYGRAATDSVRLGARRWTAFAEQAAAVGPHRLSLRLDLVADGAATTRSVDAFFSRSGRRDDARLGLHATVRDSVRWGALALVAEGGASRLDGAVSPVGALRVGLGPAYAAVRTGGRARARVDAGGLRGRFRPAPGDGARAVTAEAGLALGAGPWRLDVRAFGARRTGVRELAAVDSASFGFLDVPGPLREGGVGVGAGWRERAARGLYVRAEGTVRAVQDAGGGVRARLDAALPRAWGAARVGLRAEGVGDGVLDLDLAAVGRGWTAFRGRRVEPATGLLALPAASGPFAVDLPAQAVVGLEATATFSARASVFVRYDNALAERAAFGAAVVQGEPLPPHLLRFGVFWALLN